MKRAIVIAAAAVAAFSGCAKALAAVGSSATAPVGVTIDSAPAGISVLTPLSLPTVATTAIVPATSISAGTPVSLGSSSSAATSVGSSVASNATLTIYGQSGEAVSMAVPATFQVMRSGGTETLTVKTNTNSQYGLAGNGVVLGGSVMNADTMSVNVGGTVTLASNDQAVPGPYEGLLVVVVQYN
ncbi:DUF4402 domain-containing protein [Phenylobacterium sp.]|uniref:DUF4402 domain-containing protein n=1 Tax=Phenylobacterium sp. TaxID=1871053 RepID=UPI002DEDCBC7|nr:DUF4402 domain-containing protein [Phenylobacterium sp.]